MATDPAVLAQAVHDITTLVRDDPDRVLWVPGRAWWGLALVGAGDRAVLALDGCLTIAALCWPHHYAPSQAVELDAVLRALADRLPLRRHGEHLRLACALPLALSGRCCALLATEGLPWMPAAAVATPLATPAVWTAPADPAATAPPMPVHPWQTLAALRPAPRAPDAFLAACGEPLEVQILPEPVRVATLAGHWRACARHECARLTLCERAVPGWLEDDAGLAIAAAAWVAAHPWPPAPGAPRP